MEGELQRTLGRNLRAYRKAHDLSQENFAEIMGVHRTYMGGVERGERNLTLRSLERMAGRIEIDPLTSSGPRTTTARPRCQTHRRRLGTDQSDQSGSAKRKSIPPAARRRARVRLAGEADQSSEARPAAAVRRR